MVQYERKFLNALLDSYETSLLSRGENRVSIHVSYVFHKKNIPEYFDESSLVYESIHASAKELERKGFVSIVWKKGKENHIIQKLLLNEAAVEEIYAYLKRVPKSDYEKNAISLLRELQDKYNASVVNAFTEYLSSRISSGKSVKEYIDLPDTKQIEMLCKAVFCIENNKESCYIREFSIRHFQDSKILEGLMGKITKIWRNFGDEKDFDSMDSVLAEHYIYSTPDYIYVKGSAILEVGHFRKKKGNVTENGYYGKMMSHSTEEKCQIEESDSEIEENVSQIDLENFLQGIGISGEDLAGISIFGKASARKVITIENLTTFFRWNEKDSIIIYLGGYHNSLRRQLLKKIYEQMPEAEYLHFGDIDVGGFEIYEDLCKKTQIPFMLYHMGVCELEKYKLYTKTLTDHDKKRLDNLIQKVNEKSSEYISVLHYMRKNNVKLEQECIWMEPE